MNDFRNDSLSVYWTHFKKKPWREKAVDILYFLILVPAFLKLMMGFNARLGLSSINPYLSNTLYLFLVITGFKVFKGNLRFWDIILVVGLGYFCFWSPTVYPQTSFAVLEFGPSFVFGVLPFYFVGASIDVVKSDNSFANIGRLGIFVNAFIILISLAGITNTFDVREESMGIAYNVLPSLVLVVRNEITRHTKMDLFLSLFGVFLLFALGTRGPIIAVLLFIAGYMLLFKRYKSPVRARTTILFLTGVVYLLIEPILYIMFSITSAMGFSTRVYEKLLGNELTDASNREWIYDKVMAYIDTDSGRFGYGLFYDRILFNMDETGYAHNLIYELMLDFGIYIGSAILLFLAFLLYANLRKTRGSDSCSLLFAFFCFCVVQLFFSSSYLISMLFWVFVGLMITTVRKKFYPV